MNRGAGEQARRRPRPSPAPCEPISRPSLAHRVGAEYGQDYAASQKRVVLPRPGRPRGLAGGPAQASAAAAMLAGR